MTDVPQPKVAAETSVLGGHKRSPTFWRGENVSTSADKPLPKLPKSFIPTAIASTTPTTTPPPPLRLRGLRNDSKKTCYLNAVLQCLYALPDIRAAILNLQQEYDYIQPSLQQLVDLFLELGLSIIEPVDTNDLIDALERSTLGSKLSFGGIKAFQDAHEVALTLALA